MILPKVYLFFLSGVKKGKIEAAEGRLIRIGRQPYCEIQLDPYQDIPASGVHAQIVCEPNGTFFLADCNSSWGTFKNDARVTGPVPVTTGDVITCGVDDSGHTGPRIKFYQEKDILRCPCCSGPVYKRHFKCPRCSSKYCLRCIDFQRKVCQPCGKLVAGGGGDYEVMPDNAPAVAPARVVVTGEDVRSGAPTRRLNAVEASDTGTGRIPSSSELRAPGFGSGSGSGLRPAPAPGTGAIKRTKMMPGARPPSDPGVIAEPVGAPGGNDPLAAIKDSSVSLGAGHPARSEPVLAVPDLGDIPTAAATGLTMPPEQKIQVRRPPSIPCDRCTSPLTAANFFICDRCRSRLCPSHRAGAENLCDACVAPIPSTETRPPLPARPAGIPGTHPTPGEMRGGVPATRGFLKTPQDLISTEGERPAADLNALIGWNPPGENLPADSGDDLANAPPGSGSSDLDDVTFECPYCERPMAAGAMQCPHCMRRI